MLVNAIWTLRTTLRIVWVFATLALFSVMVLSIALPAVDREFYVVTGSSMEPSVPIGAVVIVQRANIHDIATGDVITFRGANNTVITHRVTDVVASAPPEFVTKGDASVATDPFAVTALSVIGNVEFVVPGAGALLVMMRSTPGALVTLGILGSLALTVWFMDELLMTLRRSSTRRTLAEEPA